MAITDEQLDRIGAVLAKQLTALVNALPDMGMIPVDLLAPKRTCSLCKQQLPERKQ